MYVHYLYIFSKIIVQLLLAQATIVYSSPLCFVHGFHSIQAWASVFPSLSTFLLGGTHADEESS